MEKTSVNHFFSDRVITFDQTFSDRNTALKAVADQLLKELSRRLLKRPLLRGNKPIPLACN